MLTTRRKLMGLAGAAALVLCGRCQGQQPQPAGQAFQHPTPTSATTPQSSQNLANDKAEQNQAELDLIATAQPPIISASDRGPSSPIFHTASTRVTHQDAVPRVPLPGTAPEKADLATNVGLMATDNENTAAGPSPDSFILSSRSFSIPFSVEQSSAGPVQVHLFAAAANQTPTAWRWVDSKDAVGSNDAHWTVGQHFDFTADSDGEFWFATWTVQGADASSGAQSTTPRGLNLNPHGITPQRKIFVDTTKPSIRLHADSDGDGQVSVVASVVDATRVDQLELRYVTDQMSQWKKVDANLTGQNQTVHFLPPGDWQRISLQVIATDQAGNRAVENRLVRRPRVADAVPGPRYADRRLLPWHTAGSAEPWAANAGDHWPASGSGIAGTYRTDRFAAANLSGQAPRATSNPGPPPPAASNSAGTLPVSGLSQSVVARRDLVRPVASPDIASPDVTSQPRPLETNGLTLQSGAPETLPTPAPRKDPSLNLEKHRSRSVTEAMRPLSEQSLVPKTPTSLTPDPPASTTSRRPSLSALSHVPTRFSNSQRFSLDYVLEAVDAHGVEAVELYGSTDQGQTWRLWGRDPDRESPFDIETRQQGVFGYRIVVVGRSGLASPRPLGGTMPDMMVIVDTQAPSVRISGARYGQGDRVGSLVIGYEVSDINLKERPVTLAFSESPDGPWTTIAGGLRNDGDYVWPADPSLPRGFYLRLDAVDKAGNVGTTILDKPIDAQGLAPRAKIRGFRSR